MTVWVIINPKGVVFEGPVHATEKDCNLTGLQPLQGCQKSSSVRLIQLQLATYKKQLQLVATIKMTGLDCSCVVTLIYNKKTKLE
jgi:hypothetical protein